MSSFDGYRCVCCGKWFDELPRSYGYAWPFYWTNLSEEDKNDSKLDSDCCVMKQEGEWFYFVRGIIEIPLLGESQPFLWGVWSSLSKTNFERFMELYDKQERTKEAPYFSWLSSRIDGYPDTLHLKANVITPELEDRPLIRLIEEDHPLTIEQRDGMSLERVREIAANFHSSKSSQTEQ
jgi:hypothetical protein